MSTSNHIWDGISDDQYSSGVAQAPTNHFEPFGVDLISFLTRNNAYHVHIFTHIW
jgi:hypothetical protein